jgi:hypothetical protein
VDIADRQQIGFSGGQPVPRRRGLTLGAMTIAARAVRDAAVAAVLATLDMPERSTCPPSAAERRCSIADMTWS